MSKSPPESATIFSVFRVLSYPSLWKASLCCISEIMKNFFFLQFKARLFPRKFTVTNVECPSDDKIPFRPEFSDVYLDFSQFWIRALGFLLKEGGRAAVPFARDFIISIGNIYKNAAGIYRQNMSTTERPRCYKNLNFIVIHIFDPHLLCVPSIHVMVLINTYTKFASFARKLALEGGEAGGGTEAGGEPESYYGEKIKAVFRRAVEITESVLYIKQHSINCIAAALYVMTVFEAELFPQSEAALFVNSLFAGSEIPPADVAEIREHIFRLYKTFLEAGSPDWQTPILDFLRSLPPGRARSRLS